MVAAPSEFIYVSDYGNDKYGIKATNKLPCSLFTHGSNICPSK